MNASTVQELDLRGLKCPLPALHARRALAALQPGASLRVLCTDPMSAIDIPNMVRETGCKLAAAVHSGPLLTFDIVRGATWPGNDDQ
ncbi:sulfurtransferase TusA family protein [Camelimonas abortus]|uniref:Sulfurtransferase TusA family protein n=1 Tax=Camelimonas abortus TaxID=1017184 RepID=A0ABV7LFG0_9HYPH